MSTYTAKAFAGLKYLCVRKRAIIAEGANSLTSDMLSLDFRKVVAECIHAGPIERLYLAGEVGREVDAFQPRKRALGHEWDLSRHMDWRHIDQKNPRLLIANHMQFGIRPLDQLRQNLRVCPRVGCASYSHTMWKRPRGQTCPRSAIEDDLGEELQQCAPSHKTAHCSCALTARVSWPAGVIAAWPPAVL